MSETQYIDLTEGAGGSGSTTDGGAEGSSPEHPEDQKDAYAELGYLGELIKQWPDFDQQDERQAPPKKHYEIPGVSYHKYGWLAGWSVTTSKYYNGLKNGVSGAVEPLDNITGYKAAIDILNNWDVNHTDMDDADIPFFIPEPTGKGGYGADDFPDSPGNQDFLEDWANRDPDHNSDAPAGGHTGAGGSNSNPDEIAIAVGATIKDTALITEVIAEWLGEQDDGADINYSGGDRDRSSSDDDDDKDGDKKSKRSPPKKSQGKAPASTTAAIRPRSVALPLTSADKDSGHSSRSSARGDRGGRSVGGRSSGGGSSGRR